MAILSATAHRNTHPNSIFGMMLGASAFALATCVDIVYKLLAVHHAAYQIIFVNSCFAVIPVFIWIQMTGGIGRLRTTHPVQHIARAVASLMSAFGAIYAYSRLPLTDFYAIVFAGPLLITVLSFVFLKEKVDRSRWIAIIIGFAGILIVAAPIGHISNGDIIDPETLMIGRFAAFVSISCYAISVLMIRRMRLGEYNVTFPFFGYMTALAICGTLFFLRGGLEFTNTEIATLACSGIMGGISSICLISAYQHSPVALVAPFQYTQIIWGALAGYIIWAHTPPPALIMGAIVVAGCGLYIIHQEIHGKISP